MAEPSRTIPYGRQTIDSDDVAAVTEALTTDFLTTGPGVEQFERALLEVAEAQYAVAVSSGTAALHAAYAAAGVGSDDELVTSPLTFASTANVAVQLRAKVVFADVEPATGLLDPQATASAVSRRTRAVVPIDYAGVPADHAAFQPLRERGIAVISDSSHSIGARRSGRPIGKWADAATVSFHAVKAITTGEGGVVFTDRKDWADAMRRFRHHGIERFGSHALADEGPWAYSMVELGLNYRITDFQCALGGSQLKKLERFLGVRRAIAKQYSSLLADVEGIMLPPEVAEVESAWHLYVVRVRDASRRRPFFEKLRGLGVGVQVHYLPVYWHPFYQELGYKRGLCPNAEDYYRRAVSLPIFPTMTPDTTEWVVEQVRLAARDVL